MLGFNKGNLRRGDVVKIQSIIAEDKAIVAANNRNAQKDPPGKLNHADVDGDGRREIVLSDGYVFDAHFFDLEWQSPEPFGDIIDLER